jgi:hypothetical protein
MNPSMLQHNSSTYYETAVIPPPRKMKNKVTRFVIDSRERNISLFPNPNDYEVQFIQELHDVSKVTLLSTTFPFSSYIVNTTNNILTVAYNNVVYDVEIDIGNYTETALATELQNAINTEIGGTHFKVDYVSKKDNFSIRCDGSFGLVFVGNQVKHPYSDSFDKLYRARSIGKLLGFGISNYLSVTQATGDAYTNVIASEFRKNFSYDNYITVSLDAFSANTSSAPSLQGSFVCVAKADSNTTYYDSNPVIVVNSPPSSKITKFRIKLNDFYGNLYDCQNYDHRIELLLECGA